jgi:hypothetical protein
MDHWINVDNPATGAIMMPFSWRMTANPDGHYFH